MRKYYPLLLIIVALIAFTNCKNKKNKEKYYVISQDTVNIALAHFKNKDTSKLNFMPVPPPPLGMDWYSKLVIIFDSTDKVYLYQTRQFYDYDSAKKNNANIEYSKYPNFIGLQPYQLLTFNSENFIDFIKNNNNLFELDTIHPKNRRFIYIASNHDTIKNKAYYDLISLIKPKIKYYHVSFIVRTTTEEENNVIYYKRRNISYNPEKIKWSNNFINGNCRPFTKAYYENEKRMFYIIKARDIFTIDCTLLPHIL